MFTSASYSAKLVQLHGRPERVEEKERRKLETIICELQLIVSNLGLLQKRRKYIILGNVWLGSLAETERDRTVGCTEVGF